MLVLQLTGVLKRWGPAIFLMAVIFVASSRTKAEIPDFGAWDVPVKKVGHVLLYGLLAAAWLHGLAHGGPARLRHAAWAIVLSALYGASDEYHQSFVAGRGATAADVAIDALGAAVGAAASLAWRRLRPPTRTPARPARPRSTR